MNPIVIKIRHLLLEEHAPVDIVYHGTSQGAANDIAKRGIDMSKSTKGYFGRGFYTTPDAKLAKSNYADFADEDEGPGIVLSFKVLPTAKLLDLRKPEDSDKWLNMNYQGRKVSSLVSSDNFDKMMTSLGIDGLYDNSFQGWVFYNPKVLKLLNAIDTTVQ